MILNLTSTIQLAALSTAPVVNTTQGGIRLPPQQAPGTAPGTGTGPAAGNPFLPPGIDQRIIDIPPPNETRLKTDEVMVQIRTDIGVERLRAAVANLGVSILATEDLTILGSTAVRLHIDDGRTPAEVIRALAAVQMVAVAQPQYVYNLDQAAGAPAPSSSRSEGQPGDAAQYILQKLSLGDVHRMVKGTNVPIAVIDSEIDAAHPDLEGAVTQRYDAVGAPDKPHPHGTGMAGAIAARQRLLGTAPAARILAVHAFSTSVATPESTTFNILKGINWAVSQGARVINMSFAGPKDPSLERALKVAYDRNIVLIAAAGNAGPKSPAALPRRRPQCDCGDRDRHRRQVVPWRQSRQIHLGGGARRRHPGAGAGEHLPDHHRHLGRRRRGEWHRGAPARAQSEAHPGRHPPHPDFERQAARRRASATTISARA